jgi:hypothetical protein
MSAVTHDDSFAISEPGFAVRNLLTTMSSFPVVHAGICVSAAANPRLLCVIRRSIDAHAARRDLRILRCGDDDEHLVVELGIQNQCDSLSSTIDLNVLHVGSSRGWERTLPES